MSPLDVTQAILVREPKRDSDQATQRLALFDEVTGTPYPFMGAPWIDLSNDDLSNGWHVVDDPDAPPQYRWRPNGTTELRGFLVPGDVGKIFTLPEQFRHFYPGDLHFLIVGQSTSGVIAISPNGDVSSLQHESADEWYSLATVRFSTD